MVKTDTANKMVASHTNGCKAKATVVGGKKVLIGQTPKATSM